ncbi:hypothetical protein ACIRFH_34180 [Streptomyces sp. NPDC093586]|uniref:hypothetical protein n=1 Tax=Streptomyces sp. NPDC093586 TaxID=3366042 RepID=UPI0037F427CC
MSTNVKERQRRKDATERKVMTTQEGIQLHLRRAPERDEEWVRRALVLRGRV